MKYFCKDCRREYTLPHGDYLIEKNEDCKCGKPSRLLAIKKFVIVESQWEHPADSFASTS